MKPGELPTERKMMIVLGAGASREAGIPTAREMTTAILSTLNQTAESVKVRHAVRVAVSTVIFGQGLRDEDPSQGVNIEDVFNILDTLANRNRLEAAPLIGAWNPVVEELDVVTTGGKPRRGSGMGVAGSLNAHEDARKIAEALARMADDRTNWASGELATALERVLNPTSGFRSKPPVPEPYRDIPARGRFYQQAQVFLKDQLKTHVWKRNDERLEYLAPMVKAVGRNRIPIATLNYDNCLERAAAVAGIMLNTGIKEWRENGEFGFGSYEGVPYLKLHGSITWSKTDDEGTKHSALKRQVFDERTEAEIEKATFEPAIIFGGRNKLTAEGPFLELLLRFRRHLSGADDLVVIGYSFADDHINEYIKQWFNQSKDHRVTVINGLNFTPNLNEFAERLFGIRDRVTVLEKEAGAGIKELFGERRHSS